MLGICALKSYPQHTSVGGPGRLIADQDYTWTQLAVPQLLFKEGNRSFFVSQNAGAPFIKLQIVDPTDTIEVSGEDDIIFDSLRMDRHVYCLGFDN